MSVDTDFWRVDFDELLDEYQLVIPPLPDRDPDREWCIIPFCRNDRTPRRVLCRPHSKLQHAAGWNAADLLARELHRAARPGAGCANPACPTPKKAEPAQKTLMSARQRQYAPRRFWGRFPIGGEFLCRVCAPLVNEIADAYKPGVSIRDKALQKMAKVARAEIPQATYEKLGGQQLLRSKKATVPQLTLADGYTLDQYVSGLVQYVAFWTEVNDDAWMLSSAVVEDADGWISTLIEQLERDVAAAVARDELPNYTIPYQPGRLTVDAMLGRFPKGV